MADRTTPGEPAPKEVRMPGPGRSAPARGAWRGGWPALVLVAATLAVYWPALRGGFLWDDDAMLKDNPYVKAPAGLYSIWCTARLPDYFPLTSTTLMLEWALWGPKPAGYHTTNCLLHAASAVLLWRVLRRLGLPGSWLAALLFAVHPVNVESVAWITQRKNVLAMVFYVLSALWFLKSEPEHETGARSTSPPEHGGCGSSGSPRSGAWYGLSLLAFLLGLLSKTAVVMAPVALLLCLWWQRGGRGQTQRAEARDQSEVRTVGPVPRRAARLSRADGRRLAPFFALSLVLGLVTVWFQYQQAIGSQVVHSAGFGGRLAGAAWNIWFYAAKALVPWPLNFVYPRWQVDPGSLLAWVPAAGLVLLAALCWRSRRTWGRSGLFALGYFVIMLLPVLGLVNIYFQRYSLVADHWQYFAIIAPIALFVAGLWRLWNSRPHTLRLAAVAAAAAAVGCLAALGWSRARVYSSAETLWADTLAKNPGCWLAHNNLGLLLERTERRPEALRHYLRAIDLQPSLAEPRINLGAFLLVEGHLEEAKAQFEMVLKLRPGFPLAYFNLANTHDKLGNSQAAIACYRNAIAAQPSFAEAHNNLGCLLAAAGQTDEALGHLRQAVTLMPDYAEARNNLGGLLLARRSFPEARPHLTRAVQIAPDYVDACCNLAWLLATAPEDTLRNGPEALRLAARAVELTHTNQSRPLATLAAAQAEARNFPEAIRLTEQAARLAAASGQGDLAIQIRERSALFRQQRPVRE